MHNRLIVAKFVVRVLLTFAIFIVGVVLAFSGSTESLQYWGLTFINGSWTAWLSPGKAKLKQALDGARGAVQDEALGILESADEELDAMERGVRKKRKKVRRSALE